MSKTLYLVRHAKSDWSDPSLRDFDRPLNARGKRNAPDMAKLIAESGVKPDLIVTSPAVRALTTARVFAEVLQVPNHQFIEQPSIYEASVQTMLYLIATLPDDADIVFMFGHNYTFSELAAQFSAHKVEIMPTCAVVRIDSDVETWSEFQFPRARFVKMWRPKDGGD